MKKPFYELAHLSYYKEQATAYVLQQRGDKCPPDFVPEIFVSCFSTLLFIKYLLCFLALAVCFFCGAALIILGK